MTTAAPLTRRSGHGLTYAVLAWAVAYGGIRLAWTVGETPEFPPFGSDLLGFTGWRSVALCLAAGGGGGRPGPCDDLATGARGTGLYGRRRVGRSGGDPAAGAGEPPPARARPVLRPAGVRQSARLCTGAALLGLATFGYQRRTRGDCPDCCRTIRPGQRRRAPAPWARWGAYVAVAGLVTRFAAQAVVGFDDLARNASIIGLQIGLVLAGVLLPLALVRPWGEIWPGWVPLLAGRRIPRRLLLVPGFGLGAAIVAYFGMGMAQETSGSASEFSDAFLWVAMSAYCLLGLGLLVASSDYHLRTRSACRACGR
ncbi:hypothetical protein ACLQ24_26530 [Micromonospora sp. DT4]|uniref:hypothetical protein n=1 Tax=Micromonospora sp. DT4 TaxID=3393438 RepID=UPI003CED2961